MIKQKDLNLSTFVGRRCIGFSYKLKSEAQEIELKFSNTDYVSENESNKEWLMQVVMGRTRDADSQVYNFGYIMPRNNLPLELIAATGMRYFQLYLKEEIERKINIDFALGSVLEGM